jgi:hypothetical protein
MRVGAVAVGLGYGAVMGTFNGLVRHARVSRDHDVSSRDPVTPVDTRTTSIRHGKASQSTPRDDFGRVSFFQSRFIVAL